MKLELEIDGQLIDADFSVADGVAQFVYDGQTHQAEVSEPEPGLYIILLNNRVHTCEFEKLPNGSTEIVINGKRIPVSVHDKKHLHGNTSRAAGAGGRAVLISPMPGKVVRVLVNAGDEVSANQGVLVIEAMKMQNEVQSPKTGKVAEIRVTEGQTVNAGETLAVVE